MRVFHSCRRADIGFGFGNDTDGNGVHKADLQSSERRKGENPDFCGPRLGQNKTAETGVSSGSFLDGARFGLWDAHLLVFGFLDRLVAP